jgi:hypothetical protein
LENVEVFFLKPIFCLFAVYFQSIGWRHSEPSCSYMRFNSDFSPKELSSHNKNVSVQFHLKSLNCQQAKSIENACRVNCIHKM